MPYCVNCGVELADSEKKCPLCNTEIINPNAIKKDAVTPYPPQHVKEKPSANRNGLLLTYSLTFGIPAMLALICNYNINQKITWSSYVVGACILLWTIIAVPILWNRKLPVVFVAIDTVCASAYLYMIERINNGTWFLTFALPIVLGAAIIIILLMIISLYTKLNKIKISAFAFIGIGAYNVLIELMINLNFNVRDYLIWSIYPMSTFIILAGLLFVIDHNPRLKEKLERKFFL